MVGAWILAAAAALAAADAREAAELTVMTFNIRYGAADDGPNSWPHRNDMVADCIREYDPAVFGVQECLDFQAAFLDEALPEYARFGVAREADGTGEHCAVYYKPAVLLPLAAGNFWLSESPQTPGSKDWDSSLPRMATWVRFHHIETKTSFVFLNTHFDHRGEEARARSAEVIAEQLADIARDGEPVLAVGDFNALAGNSAPWQTLADAGFEDAWLAAESTEGPETTINSWRYPPDLDGARRIDWILFRGGFRALRCETVTFSRGERFPSDHFPIVADVALPLESPKESP